MLRIFLFIYLLFLLVGIQETREMGLPLHIPYLKLLVDHGDGPQPYDPHNLLPKALWAFELPKRTTSGIVSWDTPLRIKHVTSGRYLAVDTTKRVSNVITTIDMVEILSFF